MESLRGHVQKSEIGDAKLVVDVTGWPDDAANDVLDFLTDPARDYPDVEVVLLGP